MIALQVPHNSFGPEFICLPEVKDLVDGIMSRHMRITEDYRLFPGQSGFSSFVAGFLPFIECRPRYIEFSAGLEHGATDLGILKNCPFAMNSECVSDFFCHLSDLLYVA
jgi:hypothetical protein